MDLTGEPDGSPQKIGVAFADIFTGLYGVIAIQAALAQRAHRTRPAHRSRTSGLYGRSARESEPELPGLGVTPHRLGTAHPNIVPYQVFAVADGHIMLAVGNDAQFRRFCDVLKEPVLASDLRFVTNALRVEHRDALVSPIAQALRQRYKQVTLLDGVGGVLLPAVLGIHRAERGVDAAGGQGGVGIRLRTLAEHEHVGAELGEFDRGAQAGSAGADDEDGGGEGAF